VLRRYPGDYDAVRLLAELCCQVGQLHEAAPLLRRAISINPNVAAVHFNLGSVCEAIGEHDAAITSYDQAIALDQKFAPAYFNRGLALAAANRLDEALASFDSLVALVPSDAEAHNNRGSVLRNLGRPLEAVASFDRALTLRPDLVEAMINLGAVLRDLRRPEDALPWLERALSLAPSAADVHINRARALADLDRPGEALASYDIGLSLDPGNAHAWYDRANALAALARHPAAIESYDRALALRSDHADAYNNRGIALLAVLRPQEALASFDSAIRLRSDFADAHSNRGNALYELKRPTEAAASYDRAIALRADFANPIKNKSYILLQAGAFEEGWKLYEARKQSSDAVGNRTFTQPVWLGESDIAGKTILVHAEQGLGDTIQFCRYLSRLNSFGARVLFAPQPSLRRLMETLAAPCELVDADEPSLVFDTHVPLLSLPLACKTNEATIPAAVPYLAANAERARAWRARLGETGFRVGICWQGNRLSPTDLGRSFPIAMFEGLAKIDGVRLICLQKGEAERDLDSLPPGMSVETLGSAFDAGSDGFIDTAAVMQCLDLIVTSDTAVAHLAGALARPVWLAVKHVPEWRWMLDRSDSPWYPTMRIFRQPNPGDWRSVFSEIEHTLRAMLTVV